MDFVNRSSQHRPSQAAAAQPTNATSAPAEQTSPSAPTPPRGFGKRMPFGGKWFRIVYMLLLFCGTALIVALLFFIAFGAPNQEGRFVKKDQLQAVFVNVNGTNGGQVYFGKITELTPEYIRLSRVFYIQNQGENAQAATQNSYNLVKLGCELHGPDDAMIINRSQVFFWENLKNDSQVTQKANEFYKNNPSGQQNCSQANSQQTQSTSNGATGAQSGASAATGTTSNSAPKTTTTTPATTNSGTTTNTTKKQ